MIREYLAKRRHIKALTNKYVAIRVDGKTCFAEPGKARIWQEIGTQVIEADKRYDAANNRILKKPGDWSYVTRAEAPLYVNPSRPVR